MCLVGMRERQRPDITPHMLDHEDLKWIAATSTDLNSILQQIARYSDLARRHKGEHNYIDLLGERVDLASKTAQALFDRVTSSILEKTAGKTVAKTSHAPFTVVPPPVRSGPYPPSVRQAPNRASSEPGKVVSKTQPSKREFASISSVPSDLQVKNSRGARELLLLIEDEAEVAEIAAQMLTDEGYKVIVAGDGFEALKIYEKVGKQIGLVILDYFLPVMDGDAVFDELRGMNPNVNVVLSSGFAEQHKISAMLAQGLRGFIPKPYSREKLLEQVRSTLDSQRQTATR
jgi:CheY-like chemotaxis protein